MFAQTGTSRVPLSCECRDFIPYVEMVERMRSADVIVTHAGNTVRLVQRFGKVPVVMARAAVHGEMGNDHQVHYLRHEQARSRVVAVWNSGRLLEVVERHPEVEAGLMCRPLPDPISGSDMVEMLDSLCARWIP